MVFAKPTPISSIYCQTCQKSYFLLGSTSYLFFPSLTSKYIVFSECHCVFLFFFLSSCKMLPYPLHAWAYAVKLLWEKSALRSHCGTLMTSKQDDSYYFLWLCFIWGANPQYRAYRLQITVVWAEKKGLCQDLNSHDELFYPRKGKRRGIQPTQNEHLPKTLTCGIIRFQLAQRPGVLDVA